MRKVRTPSGPFPFQLYFEDLGEIDEICLKALKRQSLLPSNPAPIRIERFVEKEFKTALRYEDFGPDNLGCTVFNSSGAVEAILVSRDLEEPICQKSEVSMATARAAHRLPCSTLPSPTLRCLRTLYARFTFWPQRRLARFHGARHTAASFFS